MTARQEKIKTYIEDFYLENQYPPSIRNIQKEMGIKSASTVYTDLNGLVQEGKVTKNNGCYLPVFTNYYLKLLVMRWRSE